MTDCIKFGVVFSILLTYLWIYGFGVSVYYFALPFLLLTQFLLIVGLTLLTAALVPFVPDVKKLVDHALQIAFFLSGIFYSSAAIPESYQPYFFLNPMATVIEAYRDILIYNNWPNWQSLIVITLAAGVGAAGFGATPFGR